MHLDRYATSWGRMSDPSTKTDPNGRRLDNICKNQVLARPGEKKARIFFLPKKRTFSFNSHGENIWVSLGRPSGDLGWTSDEWPLINLRWTHCHRNPNEENQQTTSLGARERFTFGERWVSALRRTFADRWMWCSPSVDVIGCSPSVGCSPVYLFSFFFRIRGEEWKEYREKNGSQDLRGCVAARKASIYWTCRHFLGFYPALEPFFFLLFSSFFFWTFPNRSESRTKYPKSYSMYSTSLKVFQNRWKPRKQRRAGPLKMTTANHRIFAVSTHSRTPRWGRWLSKLWVCISLPSGVCHVCIMKKWCT